MYRLLLLFAFCASLSITNAQSHWAFGVDVEGGISGERDVLETNFDNAPFGGYNLREVMEYRPGMSAGLWAEWSISKRLGLQMGLNYAALNAYASSEVVFFDPTNTPTSLNQNRSMLNQRQLRLPIEGKFYFGPATAQRRFFISAGLQWDYLLMYRFTTRSYFGDNSGNAPVEDSYTEAVDLSRSERYLKRSRASLITGLGITDGRVTLSLQRSWALKDDDARYGYNGYCINCLSPTNGFGIFPPFFQERQLFPRLRLTSLRFAYRFI